MLSTSSRVSQNFSYSKNKLSKNGFCKDLVDLPTSDWKDCTKLSSIHLNQKPVIQSLASCNKWINTFDKVASDESNIAISLYAREVATHLKREVGRNLYQKVYNSEMAKRAEKRSLDNQDSGDTRQLKKFHKPVDISGSSSSTFIAPSSSTNTAPSSSTNALFTSGIDNEPNIIIPPALSTTSFKSKKCLRKVLIKSRLFNDAEILHKRYVNEEKMTEEELKRMSIGLSGILECISDDQRCALDEGEYDYVQKKYISKYGIKVVNSKAIYWSDMCTKIKECGLQRGRKYLDYLCAQETLPDNHYRILKFYECILDLIQYSQYILNPVINTSIILKKISEGDYTYQVWLPLIKKLFNINGAESNIRLKVAETVSDDSTIEKSVLYPEDKNIIGFKIDIRCLHDHSNQQEVDVCSVEVCLPTADEKKVLYDLSKLFREGRVNTSSLIPLCVDYSSDKYTWICQISGLQAFFSTVVYVGDDLFVAINRFNVNLPTCINELDAFEKSIEELLYFKSDIERICEELKPGKNTIKMNNNVAYQYYSKAPKAVMKSPPLSETPDPPTTSNYYSPPRGHKHRSVIPPTNASIYSEETCTEMETDDEGDY